MHTAQVQNQLLGASNLLTDLRLAGNELWRWLALTGAVLASIVAAQLLRWLLEVAAERAQARRSELLAAGLLAVAHASLFVLLVAGFDVGCRFLSMNAVVASAVSAVQGVLIAIAVGYVAYCLIVVVDHWLRQFSAREGSKLDTMLVPLVRKMLRTTIIVLVAVQIITGLSDKPVASIIAGLGVGGLAIGLAAQDSVKAVFGSMVILADRPFELGDEITVDGHTGVVESVGFRSTRFSTGDGHLVTVPNGQLANMTIVNVSRRRNLVRRMQLQLAPNQEPENVQRAVAIVREILAGHEGLDPALPPRVHFAEMSSASFTISAVYWYHPPDRWKFAALGERINLEILTRFRAAGIALAGTPAPPPEATASDARSPASRG